MVNDLDVCQCATCTLKDTKYCPYANAIPIEHVEQMMARARVELLEKMERFKKLAEKEQA